MIRKPQCNEEAVFDSAIKTLAAWGVERDVALWMLGASRCSESEIRKRASLVQDIGLSISMLFENSKNIRGFMNMPNDNPYFSGQTPLQVIGDGQLATLEKCAERFKALSLGH